MLPRSARVALGCGALIPVFVCVAAIVSPLISSPSILDAIASPSAQTIGEAFASGMLAFYIAGYVGAFALTLSAPVGLVFGYLIAASPASPGTRARWLVALALAGPMAALAYWAAVILPDRAGAE